MSNIEINSTPSRIQYTATSGQTEFTIPFPWNANRDLKVYQRSSGSTADDATDLLTITTEYTLSGAGTADGGTMTLVSGATTGDIVTIIGDEAVDRSTIINNPSKLTNTTLNTQFNDLTIFVKQIETQMNQLMLKYNNNESVDSGYLIDNVLPLLGAGGIWRKNDGNTAIAEATIPTYPVGSTGSDFSNDNRLVKTDTSGTYNNIQETGVSVDDSDNLTGLASMVVAGLSYPTSDGSSGQVIGTDGAGNLAFTNQGDGDVDGPASATDNAYARFDTTSGKLIQNSQTTEDDSGNVTFPAAVNLNQDPTTALQAVTKQYADAIGTGLEFKDSVVAASTAEYTATYDNGTAGVGATLTNADTMAAFSIDGVSPSASDRVLIKDQTSNTFENGVYTVTTVGDGATNWVLTRATDYDEVAEMAPGSFVLVDSGGTTNSLTSWVQTSTVATIGTDAVTFAQFTYGTIFPSLTVDDDFIAGDPGTEGSGITVGGVTYDSVAKVSNLGGTNAAQFILHRHSTTLAPLIVGARSNSNDSTHSIVTDGQALMQMYGVGWDGTDYEIAGSISLEVDGTPGSNDMPGRWVFNVTPDGSATPAEAMRISEDTSISMEYLTASRALYADANKKITSSSATDTELGYLSGVTSAIQTQLDYRPAPNLLLNGAFSVSQRGTSFTSATTPANNDDTYLLDRWVLLSDGNDIVDVTQESSVVPDGAEYAIKLEVETANAKFGIFQILEAKDAEAIIAGTASVSFEARNAAADDNTDVLKAALLSWDSTADSVTSDAVSAWNADLTTPTFATNWTAENTPSNLSLTQSYQRFTVDGISVDTASTANVGLFIWCDNADGAVDDAVYISKVKVEQNNVATEYSFLHEASNYEACRRYYQQDDGLGIGGFALTTTTIVLSHMFPVKMRAAPTITLLDTSISINATGGDVLSSGSSITSSNNNAKAHKTNIDGFSGLTAGTPLVLNQNGTAVLSIDAEL